MHLRTRGKIGTSKNKKGTSRYKIGRSRDKTGKGTDKKGTNLEEGEKTYIFPYFVFDCPCFDLAFPCFDHNGPCFVSDVTGLPFLSPLFSLLFPVFSFLVIGPYGYNWYIAQQVQSPKALLLTQMFLVMASSLLFIFSWSHQTHISSNGTFDYSVLKQVIFFTLGSLFISGMDNLYYCCSEFVPITKKNSTFSGSF